MTDLEKLRLTDEELLRANIIPPNEYGAPPNWWFRVSQRIAESQLQKVLKSELIGIIDEDQSLPQPKRVVNIKACTGADIHYISAYTSGYNDALGDTRGDNWKKIRRE